MNHCAWRVQTPPSHRQNSGDVALLLPSFVSSTAAALANGRSANSLLYSYCGLRKEAKCGFLSTLGSGKVVCKRPRAPATRSTIVITTTIVSNLSDSDNETRRKLAGKHIVVTGGTGLIGSALCKELLSCGCRVTVLARRRRYTNSNNTSSFVPYDASSGYLSENARAALRICDAVVNLAGEPIDAGRWTAERKRVLRRSRVNGTRAIAAAIPPGCRLISASAIGYYGGGNDAVCTEDTPPTKRDFLSVLAADWEGAAYNTNSNNTVVVCRFGVVLDARGGAVPKMAAAFRVYMGGAPGDGRSWMSWVHLDDAVRFLCRALTTTAEEHNNNNISGVYNVVAPNPVMLREFCNALAHALKRPCWVPIPANAVRVLMGNEAAQLVLAGQRVLPKRAIQDGFRFHHTNVNAALRNVFSVEEIASPAPPPQSPFDLSSRTSRNNKKN